MSDRRGYHERHANHKNAKCSKCGIEFKDFLSCRVCNPLAERFETLGYRLQGLTRSRFVEDHFCKRILKLECPASASHCNVCCSFYCNDCEQKDSHYQYCKKKKHLQVWCEMAKYDHCIICDAKTSCRSTWKCCFDCERRLTLTICCNHDIDTLMDIHPDVFIEKKLQRLICHLCKKIMCANKLSRCHDCHTVLCKCHLQGITSLWPRSSTIFRCMNCFQLEFNPLNVLLPFDLSKIVVLYLYKFI
jgi:hypothetical protein